MRPPPQLIIRGFLVLWYSRGMNTETKAITLIHKHLHDHSAAEMEAITGLTLKEIRTRAKDMADYLGVKESTMGGYMSKWSSGGSMSQALVEFFQIEFDLPGAEEAIEFNDRMHQKKLDMIYEIVALISNNSK